MVGDPILRENTKDNTPAVIHYTIAAGDKVRLTLAPKGFGSENMSRVFMLKPADGIEGVKCDFNGSQGCRPQCLPADGSGSGNWRNF